MTDHDIYQIARVCHEANRAYCASINDYSQQPWNCAEEWQVESAINGVRHAVDNPGITPEHMHENWLREKKADGWTWGPAKDAVNKLHPCVVEYWELPAQQRRKDALFLAVVRALTAA